MKDLPVHIDIDILNAPCEISDINFMSQANRKHDINRFRIYPNTTLELMTAPRPVDQIISGLKNGEGCKIRGTFYKHFLMEHFVVNYGGGALLAMVVASNPGMRLDLSHRINYLYLGDTRFHTHLEG